MTAPEQHRPPVYGCAAGAVLHRHAADTLEPAVLVWTFLPVAAGEALRHPQARVDVHGDGPGSETVTLRVLAEGQALSWQLPVAPVVAALPGQPGDEGRMVLLGVVDAEPQAGFWTSPVDCEALAAELQLPVRDLVDALHGRLTPWLADDLDMLLHDDAHEHAADRSPAQTLAQAVLAHYRRDLDAEQLTARLVQALGYAPEPFQVELGSRLALALAAAVQLGGPEGAAQVREQTAPFETEALRLLTELPPLLLPADPDRDDALLVTEQLVEGPERDEAVRAAVSLVARLARVALGPDLPDGQVLQQLSMVDDAALARLSQLWVDLALSASSAPTDLAALPSRIAAEGRPGQAFLHHTASALLQLVHNLPARVSTRFHGTAAELRRALADPEPGLPAVEAAATLGRGLWARGVGPTAWLRTPVPSATQAVCRALVEAADREPLVELLLELLEPDLEPAELVDAFVCATSQLLVRLEPHEADETRRLQVAELLGAVPAGPRGARWLLVACLLEAPGHDAAAVDLSAFLPREQVDVDRAAERVGQRGMLLLGLQCLDALGRVFGEQAHLTREDLLGLILPSSLAEHDLLRT